MAVVAIWLLEHEPDKIAFDKYLSAIAAGRIDEAYGQLCPQSRDAMPDYVERLKRVLGEIGTIEGSGGIRASHKGRRAAFIDGTRKDVRVYIRMAKVDGAWRPCPAEGPLGRIEAA